MRALLLVRRWLTTICLRLCPLPGGTQASCAAHHAGWIAFTAAYAATQFRPQVHSRAHFHPLQVCFWSSSSALKKPGWGAAPLAVRLDFERPMPGGIWGVVWVIRPVYQSEA